MEHARCLETWKVWVNGEQASLALMRIGWGSQFGAEDEEDPRAIE
jgi:hypothetical protein